MTTNGWVGAYARLISQTQADPYESTNEEEAEDPDYGSDSNNLASPKKKRNMAEYRDLGWTTWHHGDKEYYYTDKEVDDALWALADRDGRKSTMAMNNGNDTINHRGKELPRHEYPLADHSFSSC